MHSLKTVIEKIAAAKRVDDALDKESEVFRLVNGLKKKGINLSEKSIFELKKKKGVPLPPGDLADEVNAEDDQKAEKIAALISELVKQSSQADYDSYAPRGGRQLQRNLNVELAKIRLRQRRSNILSALLGGGVGGLVGAGVGAHYGHTGVGAGAGVVSGAAIGGLGSELIDKMLYGGYENELEGIANPEQQT